MINHISSPCQNHPSPGTAEPGDQHQRAVQPVQEVAATDADAGNSGESERALSGDLEEFKIDQNDKNYNQNIQLPTLVITWYPRAPAV